MTAYGERVLEHFRRPRNQRRLESPSVAREAYNPLCGDRVRVELAIDGDVISSAAFTANACAICTASASLLTERLAGGSVNAALLISDDDMLEALGGEVPGGRRACATLPLHAMRQGLIGFRNRA